MKRFLTFLCVTTAALLASSCYDDSALRESIMDHEGRITALEQLTKEMNTNISSLAQIVETLQKGGGVATVVEIREAGEVIGYAVTLTDGSTVTIYGNGNSDLLEGASAVVGVKSDSDGVYYWTLNGEWMTDEDGNKIPAAAASSGQTGGTPQLKIEGEYWYVSYDNGKNWEKLGKAVAESSCIFKKVTKTDEAVIFELADGTVLTLPLGNAFRIVFDNVPSGPIVFGQTVAVSYKLEGLEGDADIFVIADDARFDTELIEETPTTGELLVTLCADEGYEIAGKIALFALSESGLTVGKSLDLVSGVFRISDNGADVYTIGHEACQLALPINTNVDFEVEVNADWLTYVETKAVEEKVLVFDVQENASSTSRQAVVRVYNDHASLYFTVVQNTSAGEFYLSYTWDETASYAMAEVDFASLTDAYGNTLASVLGYDSWHDVCVAIGDNNTYRDFAGEVVVKGYDVYTGESFGQLDYMTNGIGYWLDAYGRPSWFGVESVRTYWEFFVEAENDYRSMCLIGVMPGFVHDGDTYKQGYMFESPYGVAKVEVTINIGAVADRKLERIEVKKAPISVTYYVCDSPVKFDSDGMEVYAFYSDGSSKLLDNAMLTCSDVSTQTSVVSVCYEGCVSYVEVNVIKGIYAIGEPDCSSGWWTAFTADSPIAAGETKVWKMMCYTSENPENWHGAVVILRRNDLTEYACLRMDAFGWGDENYHNTYFICDDYYSNWDVFRANLDMSTITISVTNNGDNTAEVKYDLIYPNGEEHFLIYKNVMIDALDFQAAITVDNAYLVFFE